MKLRKQYHLELTKNLADIEKLSQILFQTKNQILYLPLKNLFVLLKTFQVMKKLRSWPRLMRKKKQSEYLDIIV